jgi:CHAD domain-containing protein
MYYRVMKRTSPSELFIRQRLRAVTRSLPAAQRGNADSLHQARVASRRLREALPVVAKGTRGRKLERTMRRLTRALGPVRELDVALMMLDELEASASASGVPRRAITTLRHVIGEERRLLHQDMCRRISEVDLDKLEARALAAARKKRPKHSRGRRAAPARLAAAEQRAGKRAVELRAAIDNASSIYLPDRLHEVRIAIKKLRYGMELTRELSGSRAAARIGALKDAQDLLGRMHDLEVLIARTRAIQGASQVPNLRVSGHLDQLVRHLERECRQLHSQYTASRRKLLSICDHAEKSAERAAGAVSAA